MFKKGDLVRVKDPKDSAESCWEQDGYLWLVEFTDPEITRELIRVKSIATGTTRTFFPTRFEKVPDHD